MKLLIVDDERIERAALRHFFASNDLGVQVIGEAVNGLQAVELNKTLKPDIITMDIRMGMMDGLKATECIKRDNPKVEIIILTAYGLFEYSQQAIKNQVFDYLLKPVKEKELIYAIERVKNHIISQAILPEKESTSKIFEYWVSQQGERPDRNCHVFDDMRITQIINYIMENLARGITLDQLAGLVHINASYLSRLFKSATGVSLSNFILKARVEKAKFLLLDDKNKPIKHIAEEVGFINIHHFSNTFKKIEGITPANYRAQGKGRYS